MDERSWFVGTVALENNDGFGLTWGLGIGNESRTEGSKFMGGVEKRRSGDTTSTTGCWGESGNDRYTANNFRAPNFIRSQIFQEDTSS